MLGGDWLFAPSTQAVFALLKSGGKQGLAVGGCVRNDLLGVPVNDVDFATDARPDEVMALARSAALGAVPTGIEHGTVTIIAAGVAHEVTTFRKDIATDGRHARVCYAKTPEEDAHRRDFTMNALYADSAGNLFDPLGGLQDLTARRVRFIDDAQVRIREDYLRILRFFRFHAWFGDPEGGIDPDALAAIAANAEGILRLSKERIGGEMRKLLAAPDPAPSTAAMGHSGILIRVLPGASAQALAPLVHLEAKAAAAPDWLVRLAAIGGDSPAQNLRLSRAENRRLALLKGEIASLRPLPELAYRQGARDAIAIAVLRAALSGTAPPEGTPRRATEAAGQKFPLRASDIASGETGPALGTRLRELEQRWIDSGFRLSKEQLLH